MARRRFNPWQVLAVLIGIVVVFLALPQSWKTWAPSFLSSPKLHLGLDLAGGTQLDFRISEEEIQKQLESLDAEIALAESKSAPQAELDALRAQRTSIADQQKNLVEAIRTVLERRVNALGVSEATITPSYVGTEKHLLVECPGVVDTQECIKVVGKTIQLEFKEEFTAATEDYKNQVRAMVDRTVGHLTKSGSTLQKEGENLSSQLGVTFVDRRTLFLDQLPEGMKDLVNVKPGQWVRREGSVPSSTQDEQGKVTETQVPGIFLVEVLQPLTGTGRIVNEASKAFTILSKTESGTTYSYQQNLVLNASVDPRVTAALNTMEPGKLQAVAVDNASKVLFLRQMKPGGEEVSASHILVSYKGAASAEPTVTRTKEEALARVKQLKAQLNAGANFADLARRESDGPSKKDGGSLGKFGRGVMAPAFEKAAFALQQNQVSDPIETQFGYHLIRLDSPVTVTPATAEVDVLTVAGPNAQSRAQQMITRLENGEVRSTEPALTVRFLFFSLVPSGWKDTTLDGKHFRHASVALDPVTNIPVVQIAFDAEGGKLFQELTKRNIGKRIAIFVGGQEVTSPRVNEEITGGTAVITGSRDVAEATKLAQDLNTGAIPAPIYLAGQYTVEATLGTSALQTSLLAGLIGAIILMIYMLVLYRLLGAVANMALIVYALLMFALIKLPLFFFTSNYVVLTLAGMAGIILSTGMAVDANVLVFERMKEELRKGKSVRSSIESSFKHAWPAIRDGNVSTLITCLILFAIGTSIVRGFAITLGLGVFLSMFTAITVTRWLLRKMAETPGLDRPSLYIKNPPEDSPSA